MVARRSALFDAGLPLANRDSGKSEMHKWRVDLAQHQLPGELATEAAELLVAQMNCGEPDLEAVEHYPLSWLKQVRRRATGV